MSYILSEAPESIYTDENLTCTIKADGDVTGLVYSIKYMYRIGNNMAWQTIHTVSGLKETSYTWVPKTSAFGFLMPNTTSAHLRILVTTQNGQMVHQSSKTVLLFLSKNISPTISNPIIRRTNSFNEKSISNITTHELNFDLNNTLANSLLMNTSNELTLGYGQYTNGKATKLYGNDISLFVKSADASFRPYYRKGDSISMSYYGAGFINNNEKEIQFSISLNRPLIGSPTITVASVNGLVIRQGGRYLYESGGGSYAKPSKYSCSVQGNMIVITATMANNTNVITKNDTIGVYASIKITFS